MTTIKSAQEAPERFRKAYNVLSNGFFNETLQKGNCQACTVGNLVAAANGLKLIKGDHMVVCKPNLDHTIWELQHGITDNPAAGIWTSLFVTYKEDGAQKVTLTEEDEAKFANKMFDRIEAAPLDLGEEGITAVLAGRKAFVQAHIDRWRKYSGLAFEMVAKTGYTPNELILAEAAFEHAAKIDARYYRGAPKEEIKLDQFNGLLAVIDVLGALDNFDTTPYKEALEFNIDPVFEPAHKELVEELVTC